MEGKPLSKPYTWLIKVRLCTVTNLERNLKKSSAFVGTEIFHNLIEVPDRCIEDGLRSKRVVPKSPRWFTSGAFRGPRHETCDKMRLVITSMIGRAIIAKEDKLIQ